jgi:pimeloyl-ACP methyl ester carboxylesterase
LGEVLIVPNYIRSQINGTNRNSAIDMGDRILEQLVVSAAVWVMGYLSPVLNAQIDTRSVLSADGVKIVYDVRGTGETALIFVHCWAGNRFFWREQADVFATNYRVVTLDLAGHGQSGSDRKQWSILGLAEDVRAVADELKLKRIILIGHSMGGPVSLQAAHLLTGRVLGVVLVDSLHDVTIRRSVESAQSDAERLRTNFAGYMGDLSSLFTKTSDPSIRHWVEQQAMAANRAVAVALKLDTPNLDAEQLFSSAGVPIRAINATPPLSDATNIDGNRKYGGYDVVFVNDAGHFLQLENPQEFNRDLFMWVNALSASGPAAAHAH